MACLVDFSDWLFCTFSHSSIMRRKRKADAGLRLLFQKHIPGWQWTPIETGLTVTGVPDSEFCAPGGVAGWIEFKAIDGRKIGLNKFQSAWIERRHRLGGRVFVAVRRRLMELWILHPACIRANTLTGVQQGPDGLLYYGADGPTHWDWQRIGRILTG